MTNTLKAIVFSLVAILCCTSALSQPIARPATKPANCFLSYDNIICVMCNPGFTLLNGQCLVVCSPGSTACTISDSGAKTDVFCAEGYEIDPAYGTCRIKATQPMAVCEPSCATCNLNPTGGTSCLACKPGYNLMATGGCQATGQLPPLTACPAGTICTTDAQVQCNTGYYYSPLSLSCTPCTPYTNNAACKPPLQVETNSAPTIGLTPIAR